MDTWMKMENNLTAIKQAGKEIVGKELKPTSYGGGPSREQQHREYLRRERIREWALSWRHR